MRKTKKLRADIFDGKDVANFFKGRKKSSIHHDKNINSCDRKFPPQSHRIQLLAYTSLSLLGLITLSFIFPLTTNNTNALDNTTTYAETRVSVQAAASIAVSLNSSVDIDITPASSGTFGLSHAKLGVATNNSEGYKIFLYASNGSSKLENTDISKTDTSGNVYAISSIPDTMSGNSFPSNTWGYALESVSTTISRSSNFEAIPTSSANYVKNVESVSVNGITTHEDEYNLAFGTFISTTLPAGTYSNSVVVSVVANPQTITSLEQLVFMQDMNSSICANTVSAYNHTTNTTDRNSQYYLNPVTKQLIDTRDGKRYWVAKLADGNCWMTQNLALDLDPAKPLTPSDSDVSSSWVPTSKTETEIPELDKADQAVQAKQSRSWNMGEIVLTNPTGSSLCPQAPTPVDYERDDVDRYTSAYYGQSITENCSEWYKNVAGYTIASEGWTSTNVVKEENKTYDSHYLLGNFYQWNAVTAGTGVATNAENTTAGFTDPSKLVDATASICPKGWTLPVSGAYDSGGTTNRIAWPYEREDGFMNLLVAYGYPSTSTGSATVQPAGWTAGNGYMYTSVTGVDSNGIEITRLDYLPMYFVRSGYMDPTYGAFRYAGLSGYGLSSTAYPGNTIRIYTIDLGIERVFATAYANRYLGFPARCLSK